MQKEWLHDFRIAYKRLIRNYNENTEEYLFALAFLTKLSQFKNKNKYPSSINCLQAFYDKDYQEEIQRQEKELQGAKNFISASHMTEKDAKEWLDKTQKHITTKFNAFIKQNKINYSLFDCSINTNNKLYSDYSKIKAIIKNLANDNIKICPIKELKIIFAAPKGIKYYNQPTFISGYDLLTNGTYFTQGEKYSWEPCGSVISDYGSYETKLDKVSKRGGIAVLRSGIIIINNTETNRIENIKNRFNETLEQTDIAISELEEIDQVSEFIGGGALLIKDSQPISADNLLNYQKFDQTHAKQNANGALEPIKPTGFNAQQLVGKRKRIFFAKYNELPYFIFASKSAAEMQKKLFESGFSDLICFDGGGGIFLATPNEEIEKVGKDSPTGFAIKGNML